MKIFAIVGNALLFLFTALLLAEEPPSKEVLYLLLTVLLLLVPILNVIVLLRARKTPLTALVKHPTILANVLLFATSVRAIVAQYPHPKEDGVVEYAVLVLLVPILTVVALFTGRRSQEQLSPSAPSATGDA